jgi:YD repeat-containing protein
VTEVELKKWDSGASAYVTQGKTVYEYDQNSLTSTSNVTNKSTPEFARRNVTKVQRYADASSHVDENLYYDDLGNVVRHTDPRGKDTYFDFADNFSASQSVNTYAFPTLATNAEGHQTETVYHYETGLPVTVTDARGLDVTFTYDLFNRPETITRENSPANSVVSYVYDDDPDGTLGITRQTTLASGVVRKVETFVDRLSRPIQVKVYDPDGNVYADTEYDAVGNVKRVSAPYRTGGSVAWTETEYDVVGRPTKIKNPDNESEITFDYTGNKVTTIDEAGNIRHQTFNAAGQLTKVEEPDPDSSGYLETNYSYYVFGPLAQVTQGSQARTFIYDWLGRMTQESHPETGTTTYTHLPDGLVASRTVTRNISTSHTVTTNYTYDDIGRPLEVAYTDSTNAVTPTVTYTYDQNGFAGFLTTVDVDDVTNSTFEYDALGNLVEENVTLDGVSGTFTTAYSYDLGGRLLTVTYPSGRVVTQSYASGSGISNSRLSTLTDSPTSATLVGSVTANAAGAITGRTLNGVITETRAFNSRNQLTHITAANTSATLLDIGYGYGTSNNIGKIRSRTDAVQPEHSAAYTFDEIGRLTAVTGGDSSWGISWELDRYGNRTLQTPSGLASGRVGSQTTASWTNNKLSSGWTYDAAGNLTDDGPNNYFYDAENRLIQINSSDVQYAYDYAGRRIKRTVGSVTTYYLYGLTGLMSEFSTVSGVTTAASTDRLQYRVGEQTGTAVMLMDASGVARENNRVFPFGDPGWHSRVPITTRSSPRTNAMTPMGRPGWTMPWRGTMPAAAGGS